MKRVYTGVELLKATRKNRIKDGSIFKCNDFPGYTFIYDKNSVSEDKGTGFWNYRNLKDGKYVEGCLADILNPYLIKSSDLFLNNIIFQQTNTGSFKTFFKRLFCHHEWEDGSNLPGCQTFICIKCGKERYWAPGKRF